MRRALIGILVCCLVCATGFVSEAIDLTDYQGKVPSHVFDRKGVDIVLERTDSRATGGPDAAGYVFTDSSEPGGPTFDWVEINGTGTQLLLGDDDLSGALPIGFTFPFYGVDYTEVYAVSNGFLSFDGDSSSLSNVCLPDANTPNNIIAMLWDDLDPGDTSDPIYYETFASGSCPWNSYAGACFVVEYEDFCHFSGGVDCDSAGTFQTILLDDGDIVLQYLTASFDGGSGATVGIENADGSVGLEYSCNTASLTDDLAIQFGLSDQIADLNLTKTASAMDVPPGNNVTYTIEVTNDGPLAATGVEVTDAIPAELTYVSDTCGGTGAPNWTWSIGNLGVSQTVSCSVTATVDVCAPITNTATATCNEIDPAPNSSDSATINSSAEAVEDGSFEAGTPNPFWNEASTNFGTPLCDLAGCGDGGGTAGARTGDWWTWFGGSSANETGSVSQDVEISGSPTLSFYLWAPVPGDQAAAGTFDVMIDGNSEFQISQGQAPYDTGYQLVQVDLSAYSGTHTLSFESTTSGGVVTFNLDDVSLPGGCGTGANVDLSLTKEGYNSGGGSGGYLFTLRNLGPDTATGIVVSDPLPAGVTHTGDTCGGTVNQGTWTWNVASLAASAQVSCDMSVAINDPLDTDNIATASSPDSDAAPSNNTATGAIPEQQQPAIPMLSNWSLVLLAMLMGGVAVWLIRRRG